MNFTDMQILALTRSHPGQSLRGLVRIARKEMPKWNWIVGKVQKSVRRLEKAGKIEVDRVVETIEIEAFRIYVRD